ncbi:MAG TPA: TMEM14 family protein [Rhabdochlamydiaceae bacterium]|nr:TMEM14 family protein [Rhabdochlamydiaceae bacterium]
MPYLISLYGILILMGGIMGHAKAGSTASLVMGVIFGVLLLVAAGCMFSKRLYKRGVYSALVLTFVLDAFFSYRYMSSMKFMPSGMLTLVSLGVMLLLVSHIRRASTPSIK